jgi:hypothetical protein
MRIGYQRGKRDGMPENLCKPKVKTQRTEKEQQEMTIDEVRYGGLEVNG